MWHMTVNAAEFNGVAAAENNALSKLLVCYKAAVAAVPHDSQCCKTAVLLLMQQPTVKAAQHAG